MKCELKVGDEEGRARALDRLDILDTAEEQPFEKVVNLVQQVMNVPMCAVSLVDRNRQWFKARRGLDVSETARDISFCTHAIHESAPFIIRDAAMDARFSENPLVTGGPLIRSYAGIPLMTPDGYNVGTLCAIDTKPRDFPASEIAILESFAQVVVNELELRQIASVDHLTGALSRRAWSEKAEQEIKRARRYGLSVSMAILDIDKFKAVNDTYGHPAGDMVIKRIAEICLETKRSVDLFGRFGGEEFVMLMPETSEAEAEQLAERLRIRFADETFDLGEPVRATVSIGVAGLGSDDRDIEQLTERADAALYEAKNNGRNQTVVASLAEVAA